MKKNGSKKKISAFLLAAFVLFVVGLLFLFIREFKTKVKDFLRRKTRKFFFAEKFRRAEKKFHEKSTHRLPTNVRPNFYDLFIDATRLETLRYQGKVQIELSVR